MGHMRQAEQAFRNALSYAERGNYAAEKAEAIGWLLLSPPSSDRRPLRTESVICHEFAHSERDDPTIQAWCSRRARRARGDARASCERARELLAARTRATRGARD